VDGRRVCGRVLHPAREGRERRRLERPLLLLHGLSCSADAWLPTLRRLEREGLDQPVIAPDMPGYGYSPGPRAALGIGELAGWAVRLLEALAIPEAHVVGNSMGCQVTLALARRHPARVGKVVLVGPTTGTHFVSVGQYLLGLMLDSLREPLRYNGLLLRMYWQMGPIRYFATAKAMLEDDPLDDPAAVAAPCMVIRGERDAILPEPVARRLAAAIPRGDFATVEGVAHAVQFSAPDRFTRIALAFLAGVEESRHDPQAITG
jgi:pimeloyl-ACP methyl ester carboxylesterase